MKLFSAIAGLIMACALMIGSASAGPQYPMSKAPTIVQQAQESCMSCTAKCRACGGFVSRGADAMPACINYCNQQGNPRVVSQCGVIRLCSK